MKIFSIICVIVRIDLLDSIALGASRSRGGMKPKTKVIALCQGGRRKYLYKSAEA